MARTANMSNTNTNDNDNGNDPDILLASFDPISVAIRAATNPDKLRSLEAFALTLTRYVDLAKANNNGNSNTTISDGITKTSKNDNITTPNANNNALSSATMPPRHGQQQQQQQRQPKSSNLHIEEHEENVAICNSNNNHNRGEELATGGSYSSTIAQHNKNGGAANDSIVELDVVDDDDDENGQQEHGNPTTILLEGWSEEEAQFHAPATGNGAGLLHQEAEVDEEVDEQDDNTVPPAGRLVRRGVGTLADSQLRRSVGLTRTVLNQHLSRLGLSAKFGRGVISSRQNAISHLTFQHRWNDLPYDENHVLRWWIAPGVNRLRLALPLNPGLHPQQQAIAIFWAENSRGGALCHYVGHFRCIHFKENKRIVEFKDWQRQALLLFQFVHFDSKLASKMADIHLLHGNK